MRIEYIVNGSTTSVIFPLPPDKLHPVGIIPNENVTESVSGIRQIVNYSMEDVIKYDFSLLPLSFIMGELRTFFRNHALLGRPFNVFEDPDSTDFETWELDERKFLPKKNAKTPDLYDISFKLRRIL